MSNITKQPKAVILTALSVEYQAVREHLNNLYEETHPKGTIYERGTFTAKEKIWEVDIVQVGQGNSRTATEAERAIEYFQPHVALFVGIAGGLKKVQLGDVVAATKVYEYESGKASFTLLSRPEVGNSTYTMQQRAQAVINRQEWLTRLREEPGNRLPDAFIGAIAAGEKVITSLHSPEVRLLNKTYEDALAVEMEGYGFLKAMHANQHVNALIIRGISDLIEGKNEADANNWQQVASKHASAFAFEILAKLGGDASRGVRRGSEAPDKPKPSSKANKFNIQNRGTIHHQSIGDYQHFDINYGNDPK